MDEAGETPTSAPLTAPAKPASSVASDSELARVLAGVVAVASVVVGIWLGNRDRGADAGSAGVEKGFAWEWCAVALLIGLSAALVLVFVSVVLRNQETLLEQSSVRSGQLRSRS